MQRFSCYVSGKKILAAAKYANCLAYAVYPYLVISLPVVTIMEVLFFSALWQQFVGCTSIMRAFDFAANKDSNDEGTLDQRL